MNDNTKQAREIFMEISELPSAERGPALEQACGGDADLRARVESLLRAMSDAEGFMGQPTADDIGQATLSIDQSSGSSQSAASQEAVGQQIDRYKLLEQIGEGGFGSVWAAEQKVPVKRRVALKIIKLGMDTKQVIARFEAERQALAMMDHPNIAKVLDAGATERGRPYFVMELVKGVPILEYCDKEKLNTKARLDLFMKVCHAIQHAHQKGIIHRDIKPGNVLVTLHDGTPVPKVIDFGIAKATTVELTQMTIYTQHHQMVGTPAYMSPEQAEMSGLDIDTRSDIYSLGVLLYELLTGTTPFAHQELMERGFAEMMRIIREETPHKPSTRLSTLGETSTRTAEQRHTDVRKLGLILRGDLDWIVMKCLEKDRTRRYDTANGLAADIMRHLSDEPVTAGPPSAGYKLRKFAKRNRGQVIAGGAVAALLVLGVAGTSWGMAWALDGKSRAGEAAEAERVARVEAQESAKRASEQAERAEAAEAEATARAEQLELVADFQAEQLSAIEPEVMGINMRLALLDGAPEGERAALADSLSAINFTSLALGTLEENIFERTIAAIDTQFESQPLVRARLLQTAAGTLRELGLLELAMDPQERALDLRRDLLGDENPNTLHSVANMGALLRAQGKLDEAEPYVRTALEGHRRVLGDDHPYTLYVVGLMGGLLQDQGKLDEAEPYFRAALEGRRRVLGDDHPHTLSSVNSMGVLLRAQGKLDEAESYFRTALEGRTRVLGDDHPGTLNSVANMGAMLRAQGKLAEAEPYVRTALEGCRRVLGDDHPGTLTVVSNMGGLLWDQGRLDEAESYIRTALEGRKRVLGDDHPSTLINVNDMGNLLQSQGKLDEVEPYYHAALEGRRRVLGDDHRDTLTSAANLGGLLRDQGKLDEAEPYFRTALEGRTRVLGDDHADTLWSMNEMGSLLQAQGRLAEAEPYYHAALEGRKRVLGDDHADTLTSVANMGVLLQSQGKLDEAEPYVRAALESQRRVLGVHHPWTLISVNNLGALLRKLGKLDEAEPYLREAVEAGRRISGDDHTNTLSSMCNLSLLLSDLGKGAEALGLADEAVATGRRVLGKEHWLIGNFLGKRGRALQALGRYDEAANVMLEAHANLTAALGEQHEQARRVAGYLADLYNEWHEADPDAGHDSDAAAWQTGLDASE